MNHPKNIPWVARDTRIKFWHRFFKSVPWVGANKTQIVYESGLNFHTVVPYLELITRNGLAERLRAGCRGIGRRRKEQNALHFRELKALSTLPKER